MPTARLTLALCATLATAAPAAAQLTVRLASPVPEGATVYVAGSFNAWTPNDPASRLTRRPDGSLALTLPDAVRGPVEFKLTLGGWDRSEAAPSGQAAPNRSVTIPATGAMTVDVVVLAWTRPADTTHRASTATRGVHVVTDSFPIPQLGRTRRLWIYLPPGYEKSSRRYPVLYMQDGQNLFDAATSFAGEWGVDESLDSLAALGRAQVIVVGIDNGGPRRLDEYNPWKNANPAFGGGEGDAYVDWMTHALKPYVDAHYRTRRDPAHTAVMGSSAGALIALYAAFREPGVYGGAGLFSTASWLTGDSLQAFVQRHVSPKDHPRLYWVSGEKETPEGQPAIDQRRMVAMLRPAGYMSDRSLVALEPADGRHAEWFWRREFPRAVVWLLGDDPRPAGPVRHGRGLRGTTGR